MPPSTPFESEGMGDTETAAQRKCCARPDFGSAGIQSRPRPAGDGWTRAARRAAEVPVTVQERKGELARSGACGASCKPR